MAFENFDHNPERAKVADAVIVAWMDLEKQMVFRTKRLIRARNVVCLRSIFCVYRFPTVCFSHT